MLLSGTRRGIKSLSRVLANGVLVISLVAATSSYGITFEGKSSQNGPFYLQGVDSSVRRVFKNPFEEPSLGEESGFKLFHSGQSTLRQSVESYLRNEQGLSPYIEVKLISVESQPGVISEDYGFFIKGIPLCNFQVRAHYLGYGQPMISGGIPSIDVSSAIDITDWPNNESSLENVQARFFPQSFAVERIERCFFAQNQGAVAAWKVLGVADGIGYEVIADAYEVLNFETKAFHVDGKVRFYENNVNSGKLQEMTIGGLVGNSKLETNYFFTDTNSVTQAKSSNHEFFYEANDKRFVEVSTFSYATQMMDWFISKGYEWNKYNASPIVIRLHARIGGTVNNALYQPPMTANGNPSISVGDGDGKILQNLPLDVDVVSHELGHHVVFRKMTSTVGDALVLHEGLADFFTFSRTGDTCLGESICPEGSGACYVQNKCLRTASNTVRYQDASYREFPPHLQGQLISGFLWDLREKGMPTEDLTTLALKGIDFLVAESTFKDFILALMAVDKAAFGEKYGCSIRETAMDRGFIEQVSGVVCNQTAASVLSGTTPTKEASEKDAGAVTDSTSTKPRSTATKNSCGVVGESHNVLSWSILLILAIPLLITIFPLPKRRSQI